MEAVQPPLPQRQAEETTAQYYVRLRKLWWSLRGEASALKDEVLAEGERQKLTKKEIAARLGVKQAWLNKPTPAPKDRKREIDPSLLPAQLDDEDIIDYCARLRTLRDLVGEELPKLALLAADEGTARGDRRTKIAADLGVSESFLRSLASRGKHTAADAGA